MYLAPGGLLLLQLGLSCASLLAQDDRLKIVNGVKAPEGKYTSLVSLQEQNYHVCGASILSKDYVLTAAHCLLSSVPLSDMRIVSAVTNLSDNRGRKHSVALAVRHRDYNESNLLINDIALLKVSPPFSLTGAESAATLPKKAESMPTGATATVVGWGRTVHGGRTSKILQQSDMRILNYWDCSQEIGQIHSTQFCATSKKSGICEGDSGGPIYADGKLIGLASWRDGSKPCGKGMGVYTQVSLYLNWIEETMKKAG